MDKDNEDLAELLRETIADVMDLIERSETGEVYFITVDVAHGFADFPNSGVIYQFPNGYHTLTIRWYDPGTDKRIKGVATVLGA